MHCTFNAVDVCTAPLEVKPHSAELITELPPVELSAAVTPRDCGTEEASWVSHTSIGTSPISSSCGSSLSSECLEKSEQSKPLSEMEELAVLREGLTELYASVIEQASETHCETLPDCFAASVLERGLLALERVWGSEGL